MSLDSTAAALIGFTAAAGLLTLTPGLDTAYVLRTTATEGARRGTAAALGIVIGCLMWTVVVAVGLGALLAASTLAYGALRLLGAAWLLWLGWKLVSRPRASFVVEGEATPAGSAFVRGVLNNLLNPKVGVFYVSFLPQFIPHGAPVAPFILLLGAIHGILGLAWFACLICATQPLSRLLRRPGIVPLLDRATGGLFLAFGVALAAESRRAVT
jgi:threonine/homoserine/homoserine lactone efflux protein